MMKLSKKFLIGVLVCLFTTLGGFAQQKSIRGTVTDNLNEGLPGVTVTVKGVSLGVATDLDGNFQISVPNNKSVLVFSCIGFVTKEVTVGNQTTINVVLEEEAADLDEVVVIGYGTARKRDLSGSISSLKPSEELAATSTSFDNLLQGRVAGLNISGGGSTPGSASSIIIRGANSLTGDSQPLYVIDNVPQSSTGQTASGVSGEYSPPSDPLAGINMNDIEDVQILKDASATAIYGSRGANGVIIITTKRGKEGKPRINLSANLTIANAVDLLPLMNLRQYGEFYNERNGTPSTTTAGAVTEPYFIFNQDGTIDYSYISSSTSSTGVVTRENKVYKDVQYRDWLDEILRTAISSSYNLNINGGGKNVRYNVSLGYRDVEGIIKNTGLKHGDFRMNLGLDLSDKVTANIVTSAFLRKNDMMSGGTTVGRSSGAIIPTALTSQPFLLPRDDQAIDEDNRTTVHSWLEDYDDITNEYRVALSGDVSYKINKDLTYTFRAGGVKNNMQRRNWYGTQLFRGYNENGYLFDSSLDRNNYNVENLLNYNKTFRNLKNLNLGLTAGITYDAYTWLNKTSYGTNFPFKMLRIDGMQIAENVVINTPVQRDYQLLSYLGRANLSFLNGRYVVTTTFRADGTSKFSKENRWAYFPSFAGAWNIQEESFMKNLRDIDQLKLRAGWGVTGSQNINPYVTIFGYGSGTGYATPSGSVVKTLGVSINNPDLKWETTSSVNLGIDFGFLHNRVGGSIDVYNKTTKDLLVNISAPGSSSLNTIASNNGKVQNKGLEILLRGDVIRKKDLTWSVNANVAFNKSKVLELGTDSGVLGAINGGNPVRSIYGKSLGDHFGIANVFIEGYAPGLFFGYKTNGIVQESEATEYTNKLGSPFTAAMGAAGNLKYVDVNGDGSIDENDKTIIGDPNPDFVYGFNTTVNYKRFRLSASFSGVKGGDILNTFNRYQNLAFRTNGGNNFNPAAYYGAWRETNTNTNYPALTSIPLNGNIIDRYVEDGSYLRCTDLTLGYNLPAKLLKKANLRWVDVYVSVKNLFTITDYSGFDVTSRSYVVDPLYRGIDAFPYPAQRSIIVGTSITF